MLICMQEINFISNFFLIYCKNIANLKFGELWECLTDSCRVKTRMDFNWPLKSNLVAGTRVILISCMLNNSINRLMKLVILIFLHLFVTLS